MSASTEDQKLPLMTLTAMVVGGMVGAGVFSIPRNFAQATGVYGALIAWAIAGAGMLMLAFVFQTLANRKPDLDAGVYAYARAGFGPYLGFFSAFGYWASACVGNVSYWILIKSTLGAVFPVLGEGNTLTAVLISSVGVWAFHFLVLRGVKEAAGINRIVTIAKIIPLLLFVVLAIFFFDGQIFAANLWGGDGVAQEYLHAHGDLDRRRHAGRRRLRGPVRAGQGDDARDRLRVPRHRGREQLLAVRETARGRGRRHRDGLPRRARALRVGVDPVLRHPAPRRAGAAQPALRRRRARSSGRPLGREVHRRGRHRLGARRLPRLDADVRRSALDRGEEGRHAEVPGAREREPGAFGGAADEHAAGAAGALCNALLRRRLHLRALALQPPVAASLFPLRSLRVPVGSPPRDLRQEPGRRRQGRRDRGAGVGLHRLPGLRGRSEVPAARIHHLRSRARCSTT